MADGTPWKHDLSHDSTISLWVAGAVMNMARLPIFVVSLPTNTYDGTELLKLSKLGKFSLFVSKEAFL